MKRNAFVGNAWKILFFFLWLKRVYENHFSLRKCAKTGIEDIPRCKIVHKRNNHISTARKHQQCNYLNHKNIPKSKQILTEYYECLADTFGFTSIDEAQLRELCFNSNFICNCLNNDKQPTALETCTKQLPNLQEISFNKNCDHVNKDLTGNIADHKWTDHTWTFMNKWISQS